MYSQPQPTFWLQVKEEYIFDNLDALLRYLQAYVPSRPGNNEAFVSTVSCIDRMLQAESARLARQPASVPCQGTRKLEDMIKLYGASVLVNLRQGSGYHEQLLGLINLLLHSGLRFKRSIFKGLWDMAVACIGRAPLKFHAGLSWNDLRELDASHVPVFVEKFAKYMTFDTVGDGVTRYMENMGTLTVSGSKVSLTAMNVNALRHTPTEPMIDVDGLITVDVAAADNNKHDSFTDLWRDTQLILESLASFKPSPEITHLNYKDGDEMYVVVTEVDCDRRVMRVRTIDPAYAPLEGKINYGGRIDDYYKLKAADIFALARRGTVVPGTVLKVRYTENELLPFSLSAVLQDWYLKLAERSCDKAFDAVFLEDKGNMTLWVLENGLVVRLHNNILDDENLDDSVHDFVVEAMENLTPVRLRLYAKPNPNPGIIYANIEGDARPSDSRTFGLDVAVDAFLTDFIDQCSEESQAPVRMKRDSFEPMEPGSGASVLEGLLMHALSHFDLDSRGKLEYITAAQMLASLSGRRRDADYLTMMSRYHRRLVDFSANREVHPLNVPENVADMPDVKEWSATIDHLLDYHRPDMTGISVRPSVFAGEDNGVGLSRLIEASNSLAGILGERELNDIKLAIAKYLKTSDEFVPIVSDRLNYGTESLTLEFKKSIVFPPLNRSRYDGGGADPSLQKWAILKAICGFFNKVGGDLLLGVNDGGYADGVEEDMAELARMGLIASPDIDHYSRYIQERVVYNAFGVYGSDSDCNAIVADLIEYHPEVDDDGHQIMRIHVRPYPGAVVRLRDDNRPDYIAESYVRESGRNIAVTPELLEHLMQRKMS